MRPLDFTKPPPLRSEPRAREFVIIASGPSLTAADCELVRHWRGPGRMVIVLNTSFRLAPWADVFYAPDTKWWRMYAAEALQVVQGEKWTCSWEPAQKYGLKKVRPDRKMGLCRIPGAVNVGGNAGYQAINLAYHFGAERIVLLGYDMQHTGGRRHWHPDHPCTDNANGVAMWRQRFTALARDLQAERVVVENATRETALRCFPRIELETALGHVHDGLREYRPAA